MYTPAAQQLLGFSNSPEQKHTSLLNVTIGLKKQTKNERKLSQRNHRSPDPKLSISQATDIRKIHP